MIKQSIQKFYCFFQSSTSGIKFIIFRIPRQYLSLKIRYSSRNWYKLQLEFLPVEYEIEILPDWTFYHDIYIGLYFAMIPPLSSLLATTGNKDKGFFIPISSLKRVMTPRSFEIFLRRYCTATQTNSDKTNCRQVCFIFL